MTDKTFNRFYAQSDIVVIGSNPESADYTNPRGEIYGFAAYVVAANEYGDTRSLHVATAHLERDAMEKAEAMAAALTVRFEQLGKPPVGFANWSAGRAVYGSDAYQDYGAADDLAWEMENA